MDDVIVVGAGPAGLAAALYLARYRRSVRVLHDGRSRALLAPLANNVPAFPDGISGRDLLARMQRQAERYGGAEAMFLRQYSHHVTLLAREPMALTPDQRAELAASRVRVLDQRVRAIRHIDGKLAVDVAGEARPLHFDTLYPALGSVPRACLARQVGVVCDDHGALPAYGFAEPLLPGFFAAGDVLRGLDQIVVAAGQGAIAATRLHNWLRARDRHMLSDQAAANGT